MLILQMCSNADEGEKIFKYYLVLEGDFMEVVSAQLKGAVMSAASLGQGAPSDQAVSNALTIVYSSY